MSPRINLEQIIDTFLACTRINTTAIASKQTLPSCENQLKLAELVASYFADNENISTTINSNAITKITLSGNKTGLPSIVFFSHLDTAPDHDGDTHAIRVKNYDGTTITLPTTQETISPDDYPELLDYVGQDIITTDGTSLLGADDKAAIAAGIEAMRYMIDNPEFLHGDISLVLLPDEEIGIRGAKALNVAELQADYGICLDCCGVGEYVIENWYAGSAKITVQGVTAHPMSAKGKLVNALSIASNVINRLPAMERPEHTEGREGYYWPLQLVGDTAHATLDIAIRDFEITGYQARKQTLQDIVEDLQAISGTGKINLVINDVYDNVKPSLDKNPNIMANVELAMRNLNIKAKPLIMRGGYDGSVITPNGLPTINIFTGAHNFHSTKEYLPTGSLRLAAEMLLEMVELSTKEVSL
ncbi:peptidase T [Aeromonas allosaccharophila]|uniref:Peptidase T n=1 Tax=Aeromonas allosaccharophila TaxID=656 RepID=A0A7T2PCK7_9GAMM|nr:peptidase T [Aeromonas allosaccharophila]QPR53268.1 peptidase T [Aeromonas allosaccharophila]